MKKDRNHGFSLVELLIVICIMAVLMGILIPTLVRHTNKSKRSVDANTADEIVRCFTRVISADTDLYNSLTSEDGSAIRFSWNSSTSMESLQTLQVVYDTFQEFGSIPVSRWDKSLNWIITFNGTDVHIYLADNAGDSYGYELYPDSDTYVKKKNKVKIASGT